MKTMQRSTTPATSLRTATKDGTLEVILGGEIDMGAAFRLESSFDAALAAEGLGSAVLDLADVTFIDSAGLGALRSMQDRAGQRGVEFSVRASLIRSSGSSMSPA